MTLVPKLDQTAYARKLIDKLSNARWRRSVIALQMVPTLTKFTTLFLAVFATVSAPAQTFEVASVKLSAPNAGGRRGGRGGACAPSFNTTRGRVDIRCAHVATLIEYAYRLQSRVTRPTGPDWIGQGGPTFDIAATLPPGASETQVPEMLQALLADRFQLAVHRVITEQPVYALLVAKSGLKVKEVPPEPDVADSADGSTVVIGGVQTRMTRITTGYIIRNSRIGTVHHTEGPDRISLWDAPSTTLEGLADLLSLVGPLSSDVKDMTGLKARYPVNLQINLNESIAAASLPPDALGDRAAMQNVVMEREDALVRVINNQLMKLGLQLERRKSPLETLAVDRVQRPSEN